MLYWNERRSEFNVVRHIVFPFLSTLGMLIVFLFAIGWVGGNPLTVGGGTFPTPPLNWAVVFTGIWLVAGVVILFVLRAMHKEDWIAKAAVAASERPATDEEIKEMAGEW